MTRHQISLILPVLITLVVFAFSTPSSHADIPQVISYQGKVTDTSGNPVADDTYTMRFQIYDQLIGGSPLWDSGNQSVALIDGIFSVMLGGTGQPALDLSFDDDYWLQVSFQADVQTPRRRLGSVGYAYMAEMAALAAGLVPGTVVSGSITDWPFAAVKAVNSATTGDVVGFWGESACPGGGGVFGYGTATTDDSYGVFGMSNSTAGMGVYGSATATSGTTYGVYGSNASSSGHGVYGHVTAGSGTTYGIWGESESTEGCGVFGKVSASTGQTYGVRGESESSDGVGVRGICWNGEGTSCGVRGETYSTDGRGVYGVVATISVGGTAYGVYGSCAPARGYAIYAEGDFAASGAKNCIVKTSQGPLLMYCQESPECWFEDFGEGQLVDGRCQIDLDPLFLETVTIDDANPMKVYVTPNGAMGEWWVDKEATGFTVVAKEAGDGTRFDYRIVAKRNEYEQRRLDYCKAAENDSFLFPELRKE